MPSKKVISIFILCSALVLTIIIISNPSNPTQNTNLKSVVGISGKNPEVNVADNPNWQKDISGIAFGVVLPEEATTTDETLTDTFSRSFMANYLALKQKGPLDNTSATNLIDKSVEFINQTDTKTYGLKDIIVSPDNSKLALTKYGNDLGVLSKMFKQIGAGSELALFQLLLVSQDTNNKAKLQSIAKSYDSLTLATTKIIVPSNFSARHLIVLNSLSLIANSINSMSLGEEDPVKSLSAINNYKQAYTTLADSVRLTQVELIKAGVNYKQGENGYYFYFGI